jgi:hypothetical protein
MNFTDNEAKIDIICLHVQFIRGKAIHVMKQRVSINLKRSFLLSTGTNC